MNIKENNGKPQVRNIRSMLKKTCSVEKSIKRCYNSDNSSNEVSFDITPEEDELKKELKEIENETITTVKTNMTFGKTNQLNNNNTIIHTINKQSQQSFTPNPLNNTDDLINESKKMLLELDKKAYQTSNLSINNPLLTDEMEERPYAPINIAKTEKDEITNNIVFHTLPSNTTTSISIGKNNIQGFNNALNNRLLEKIKQIKTLERELKDKKELIERQKRTIEKQSNEIKQLNAEKNPKYKTEVGQVSKQLKEKEEELISKQKLMESLVEQYKEKINDLINANGVIQSKLSISEAKNKELKDLEINRQKLNATTESKIKTLEKQLTDINTTLELERTEKTKLEAIITDYKGLLHKSMTILTKAKGGTTLNKEYLFKLRCFFSELEEEEPEELIDLNQSENNI